MSDKEIDAVIKVFTKIYNECKSHDIECSIFCKCYGFCEWLSPRKSPMYYDINELREILKKETSKND